MLNKIEKTPMVIHMQKHDEKHCYSEHILEAMLKEH